MDKVVGRYGFRMFISRGDRLVNFAKADVFRKTGLERLHIFCKTAFVYLACPKIDRFSVGLELGGKPLELLL